MRPRRPSVTGARSRLSALAQRFEAQNNHLTGTLPSGLVSVVLGMLESSVEKSAKFSIQWLTPITYVDRCWAPALFMLADHDPLITMQHIETLAKNYSGPRTLAMVAGNHSSPRNRAARDCAQWHAIATP